MNARSWLPSSVGPAALTAGLITAGLVTAAGGMAHADTTSGSGGLLSGNQISIPITAPITVCGNSIALLGNAGAACDATVKAGAGSRHTPGGRGPVTSGRDGVVSGNQIHVPVAAPITMCGNSVAVLGSAKSGCDATVRVHSGGSSGSGGHTSGEGGIGSGNQIDLPISIPVSVCGNAVGGGVASPCDVTVGASTGSTGPTGNTKPRPGRHHRCHKHQRANRDGSPPGTAGAEKPVVMSGVTDAARLPFTGGPFGALFLLALTLAAAGSVLFACGRTRARPAFAWLGGGKSGRRSWRRIKVSSLRGHRAHRREPDAPEPSDLT